MPHFGSAAALPFFTGTLTVAVDNRYDVGLAGHSYMVDWERADEFRHESVAVLREQADQGERPGEQSLNPAGLWRRASESWHHGAGQSWLDRAATDPFRFASSKGIDPWDKYALTLLPDTTLADAAAGDNLFLAVAGGRLYTSDGQTISVTGVGNETLGAATGTPAVDVTALASDGATCYAGFGASGIYSSSGTAFASFVTGTVDLVRYAKGRLLAAAGPALYNPTAAGALPTALFTHPSASWEWTDITEGQGHIYAAGYAGDKSSIYRIAVKADGTGLDVPVVAATLPDGELARSVTGYVGFVIIGTSLGVRFAVPDDRGDLNIGALIETGSPVLCAEGQGQYVWYGLTNYDADSTGLGRLDPSEFTSALTPAYASDLMADGAGDVVAVATHLGKRWFTVAGQGVYKEAATKVASGSLVGGRIGFGLPDQKHALYLSVRHDQLAAGQSVSAYLATDGGSPDPVGTSTREASTEPLAPWELVDVGGGDLEWTITLEGDVTLRSVYLLADPAPASRTEFIYVPILLRDRVEINGVEQPVDVAAERAFLTDLRDSRRVVTYQEGEDSVRVIVEDTQFRPWKKTADRLAYQGTFLVKLKGV